MTEEVYEKLARHLDRLPAGFPRTESGVELRILKRLFNPEEAELACRLQMMPEPAAKLKKTRSARSAAQVSAHSSAE